KAIPKKLLPGPKPFPLIGNLLEVGDKPHKFLTKLSKDHGPIISVKLGQVTTILWPKKSFKYMTNNCPIEPSQMHSEPTDTTSLAWQVYLFQPVDLADSNSNTAREYKEIIWNIMKEDGRPNLADYFPV
ncbi:inactive cytochrome p450 76ad1, partial [Quercus suber]